MAWVGKGGGAPCRVATQHFTKPPSSLLALWQDAGGDTLLHYAAQQGNAVVTAKLLNAGADPNMRNEAGCVTECGEAGEGDRLGAHCE